MKAKHLLFTLLVLQAGMSRARVFPDDYWGYVNTLQDEWLRQICTVGLDTVYIVGEDGLIARSTDRGDTWDKQHCTQAHLNDIAFFDTHTGLAAGEGGTILRTTDAGATWLPQASGTTETINALAFVDADHVWAVGTNSLVLHSADGGATWEKRDIVDAECTLNDIAFRGDLGYMVGNYGMVYKTEDAGKNWQRQEILENPGMGDVFSSLNIMENKTYIHQQASDIFSSENQQKWARHKANFEDIYFINDSIGYYLSCPGITTNNGSDMEYVVLWKTRNGATNHSEDRVESIDYQSYDYATDQMRGKEYCNRICMVNEYIGYAISGQILLKKPAFVYPTVGTKNIAEEKLSIKASGSTLIINSNDNMITSVSVFDAYGKLLIKNSMQNQNFAIVETAHLSPGVYFINVVFSDNHKTAYKWVKH